MNIKLKAAAALALGGALTLSACGGNDASGSEDGGGGDTLDFVGFSVLESVNEGVFGDFAATDDGSGVELAPSYGASGEQSRAVEAGQTADIVHFSLEPDMQRVVDAGLVAEDWKDNDTKGICSQSVVSFVVRTGNPENITGWDDLTGDVEIITPNPASSGSAKWNLLAAYGQVIAGGGSDADAEAYMKDFFSNVAAFPDSARDATTAFTSGQGDVLLSYENEAILARQNGTEFDYLVPDETLLIENPCAVTEDASESAEAFLDFVKSEEGQADYVASGFRPLVEVADVEVDGANEATDPFPTPAVLQTVDEDFGGWADANTRFFDEEEGILTKLQAAAGE